MIPWSNAKYDMAEHGKGLKEELNSIEMENKDKSCSKHLKP